MAIHGVRGKGKTNTGVVIVEEALDQGVQVVIVNPTDVWWGLKSTRDGKRAGAVRASDQLFSKVRRGA